MFKLLIMSSKVKVVTHIDAAYVISAELNLAAAKTLSDTIVISMSESVTKALIKVGPKRTAEGEAIFTKLLKPFPSTIAKDYTLADFESIRTEIHNTNALKALHKTQAKVYEVHANVLEHDLILMYIECLDNGRLQMKSIPGMATAVDEITTEFFPHSATNTPNSYSIAPASKMEITNIETGKRLVNDGTTMISALVKGGNAANTITIYPGDSILIPKGWVNVVITNISATTSGSFQLFTK